MLRLFEASDDPAHPRVVDDLLEYRGMQRAFEARGDYRGCRDRGRKPITTNTTPIAPTIFHHGGRGQPT